MEGTNYEKKNLNYKPKSERIIRKKRKEHIEIQRNKNKAKAELNERDKKKSVMRYRDGLCETNRPFFLCGPL